MRVMLPFLVFIFNIFIVTLNSVVSSVAICVIALFKVLLPNPKQKAKATSVANQVMWLWATINAKVLAITNRVEWDIEGGEQLKKDGWYLLISNHLSWTDIVVLCCVFKDRIPMPKFFLKQQLMYIPFLGYPARRK